MDDRLKSILDIYSPSELTKQLVKSVQTILLVGISGAGKNTITGHLLKTGKFHLIISHTTRLPRKNHGVMEKDGVEYHFVSHQKIYDMLTRGEFVEAKKYASNVYGTSVNEFLKAAKENKYAIADIEVQGVAEYMSISPEKVKPIFLLPPNFKTWKERFHARYEGVTGKSGMYERMQAAIEELQHLLHHPYFSIVVNDNLVEAVAQVQSIVDGEVQSDAAQRYGQKIAHELLNEMKIEL